MLKDNIVRCSNLYSRTSGRYGEHSKQNIGTGGSGGALSTPAGVLGVEPLKKLWRIHATDISLNDKKGYRL